MTEDRPQLHLARSWNIPDAVGALTTSAHATACHWGHSMRELDGATIPANKLFFAVKPTHAVRISGGKPSVPSIRAAASGLWPRVAAGGGCMRIVSTSSTSFFPAAGSTRWQTRMRSGNGWSFGIRSTSTIHFFKLYVSRPGLFAGIAKLTICTSRPCFCRSAFV